MEACGLATELRTIRTADGVAFKARRYLNEGAQPVLLLPGFTCNGCEFELPHARQNLALYLAAQGYDVWVASFRGAAGIPVAARPVTGAIPSTTSPPWTCPPWCGRYWM